MAARGLSTRRGVPFPRRCGPSPLFVGVFSSPRSRKVHETRHVRKERKGLRRVPCWPPLGRDINTTRIQPKCASPCTSVLLKGRCQFPPPSTGERTHTGTLRRTVQRDCHCCGPMGYRRDIVSPPPPTSHPHSPSSCTRDVEDVFACRRGRDVRADGRWAEVRPVGTRRVVDAEERVPKAEAQSPAAQQQGRTGKGRGEGGGEGSRAMQA